MKKLLAIFAFFAITLSVSAQEKKVSFQEVAKEKTQIVTKQFQLNPEKQRTVRNAYLMSERKLAAMRSNPNAKVSTKAIENVYIELYDRLSTVLTTEQIEKVKNITNEKRLPSVKK